MCGRDDGGVMGDEGENYKVKVLLTDFPVIKGEGREKTSAENRKQGWGGKEGGKRKQRVSETHRAKSCACAK